jgi:hypothetical protein
MWTVVVQGMYVFKKNVFLEDLFIDGLEKIASKMA